VFGRKVNQRNPQCQNIAELINAILKERQWILHGRLRRLAHGMDCDVSVVVTLATILHAFIQKFWRHYDSSVFLNW
jgi:hypothetical protein